MRAIYWIRQDLRLKDNPALGWCADNSLEVLPIFIYAPEEEGDWALGGASKWWLHESLTKLKAAFNEKGLELVICRAKHSEQVIVDLLKQSDAKTVVWNRRYEPSSIARDTRIKQFLQSAGFEVKTFNSHLLWEPWEIKNGSGLPFQVFTPFFNKSQTLDKPALPRAYPKNLKGYHLKKKPTFFCKDVADLELLPKNLKWYQGFAERFSPGEESADKAFKSFLAKRIQHYKTARDFPAMLGTSELSPHLRFGEISPRHLWAQAEEQLHKTASKTLRIEIAHFQREIAWREFAYHLLYHFPKTPIEALRVNFRDFPWKKDSAGLKAWQKGMTGYPIVDAGMRELWHTGYMHNRVRMIVASFLVKDLRISWLEGAKWFWDTLCDADLASNTLGWQWAGGCGADAAPYFRVFNPTLQGKKFDPQGEYVKRWVPELQKVPAKLLHGIFDVDAKLLADVGVVLGKTYPKPLVNHKQARDEALQAFKGLKKN